MTFSPECKKYACPSCPGGDCDHACHGVSGQETLFEPARPYTQDAQPSAGWSGTDTSKAAEPVRARSQRAVLSYVTLRGVYGATVKEARDHTQLHHGVTSSALTTLHKAGRLARLLDRREKCRVYVTPDNLNGREAD